MARRTLIDFFDDLALLDGEFLVYDDGYRTWSLTYAETAAAARAFAGPLARGGHWQRRRGRNLEQTAPNGSSCSGGASSRASILVPIDYRASATFLGRVAEIVSARAILAGEVVDTAALTDPASRSGRCPNSDRSSSAHHFHRWLALPER